LGFAVGTKNYLGYRYLNLNLFLLNFQENTKMAGPIINFRSMIIELLGTMFLVWYGGMAISMAKYTWTDSNGKAYQVYTGGAVGHKDELFGIALCHGLILGIWIYAGAAAGADCHFNPAVTLGFILGRKCNLVKVNF
jgi:glycerol uptake facilitator-like aquaporin